MYKLLRIYETSHFNMLLEIVKKFHQNDFTKSPPTTSAFVNPEVIRPHPKARPRKGSGKERKKVKLGF